jgi:SAM-dependent methyltransferase
MPDSPSSPPPFTPVNLLSASSPAGHWPPYIPDDHARQTSAGALAERALRPHGRGAGMTIIDLGCGGGRWLDFFGRVSPEARWIGVDVDAGESIEVSARRRSDGEFRTFDGVHIPAPGASADVVFSNQSLMYAEHVGPLLADVRRVLKVGGSFIGSVSQMEPEVTLMRWNFTAHGFAGALAAAGLTLRELRPGIDAITLILRRLIGRTQWFDRYFERESPLNRVLGAMGRLRGKGARVINARKILFAGQLSFWAVREKG